MGENYLARSLTMQSDTVQYRQAALSNLSPGYCIYQYIATDYLREQPARWLVWHYFA